MERVHCVFAQAEIPNPFPVVKAGEGDIQPLEVWTHNTA